MQMKEEGSVDLSVILPCRNEENTVEKCVEEVYSFFHQNQINGEVLVVDNASTDASMEKALACGARLVREERLGYGSTLRTGIAHSRGRVIIMGDCDTTYDFLHMHEMYQLLFEGQCDMVIGNRFEGGLEPGSMSWIHQLGVRFLSFLGRKCFHCEVKDFHCGMRGMTRKAAEKLMFHTDGMEFATEMIAEAVKNELRIMQVPVFLRKCNYNRKSKLRTIRDGLRHLVYMINNSN